MFQQFITYELVSGIATSAIFAIVCIICVSLFVWGYKNARFEAKQPRGDPAGWALLAVCSGVATLGFLSGSLVFLKESLLVYFAPKVYLLKLFLK